MSALPDATPTSVVRRARALGAAGLAASLVLLGACSDAAITEVTNDPTRFRTDSVDAGGTWTYVSLANPGTPLTLTPAQARTSTAWDIGFNGFETEINGGETGPGGIVAHCLCQNTRTAPTTPTALAGFFGAMTPESELADFTGATASQVPADSAFRADTLAAVRNWFSVGAGGTRALQPYVYALSLPNGTGFAKFQIVSVENPTGTAPGRVTFQYATTPNPRTTPFGAARTGTVTVPSATPVAFSFASNGTVDATAGTWDVRFEGWRIRTNSGGRATAQTPGLGAYNVNVDLGVRGATFETVTAAQHITSQPQAYQQEGAGPFDLQPTWFYDSANRRAFPTFDVYLLKRGATVHKVQVIRHPVLDFATGRYLSRFVLFRSSRIAG